MSIVMTILFIILIILQFAGIDYNNKREAENKQLQDENYKLKEFQKAILTKIGEEK